MSGSLRLNGSTSGFSEITAPDVAGDQTFTLPAVGGTLSTSNVVYQQGLWTPDYGSTQNAPVFTATQRTGAWSRIGNTVTIQCTIVVQGITTAGTGSVALKNLPYVTASTEAGGRGVGSCYAAGWANGQPTYALATNDSSELRLYGYGANNAASSIGTSSLKAGAAFYLTVVYQTADTTFVPINGATIS